MLSQTERNLTYPIALLLSSAKRKTFESLGQFLHTSGDSIIRLVSHEATTTKDLLAIAREAFGPRKKLYLLIDDTLIAKIYSRFIEGTCDHYDSAQDRTYRSLCSVVAMITDGESAIPIDQSIWTSREFCERQYQTKTEIAQSVIMRFIPHIRISILIMDGLYATQSMIRFCNEQHVAFETRFHSNRVIEVKRKRAQIKNGSFFKLSGRRPRQTIRGYWKGISLYFTAHRRRLATGEYTTVYQVSNYKASAREHTALYGYRWNIEKFFRTGKQLLGLNDCQSRKLDRQENHIMNVFLAYALAQLERIKNKLNNVEMAIKLIKQRCFESSTDPIAAFREIFGYA